MMLGFPAPVSLTAPGYRRIDPDLEGMGKTPAPESLTGSDDMLAAVHGFVDDVIGDEPFPARRQLIPRLPRPRAVRDRPSQVLGLVQPTATAYGLRPKCRRARWSTTQRDSSA
jgi:hypothetical protein